MQLHVVGNIHQELRVHYDSANSMMKEIEIKWDRCIWDRCITFWQNIRLPKLYCHDEFS